MFTIKQWIKLQLLRIKWRKKNKHNFTEIKRVCDIEKISVGNSTYGDLFFYSYGDHTCNLVIGSFCSIADNVVFLGGGEHNYKLFSTYPFKVKFMNEKTESFAKGDIIIEDDVWIGLNSMILSGVRIGRGAVIGAGSVVRRDIPPYAIYVGDKIIKYRFEKNVINELQKIDLKKLNKNLIQNHINLLYKPDLNVEDVKMISELVKE